jgi:hypothetical protein
MQLTSEKVTAIFTDCLFKDGEKLKDPVIVEGILNKFGFHSGRLASHKIEIEELLAELPETFMLNKGGGWSFLNACQDKHGNQWTGLHLVMEQLFCLGLGVGRVAEVMPRTMWPLLPGGVPYYAVTLPPEEVLDLERSRR